jgi:hypothetical protein
MLANNLCSSCLDIGFNYPAEDAPLNRVKQIKNSSHNKDSLFYIEIIFALDNKNKPYVGVSDIMKVDINLKKDINKLYEYFSLHSLDSIKYESEKNLKIISNQEFKNKFLSKYNESEENKLPVKFAIEVPKNNFLYRGIETEVNIAIPEKKVENIYIKISNAEFRGENGRYFVKALNGNICEFSVKTIENGDTTQIATYQFRVHSIPNPTPSISGSFSSSIISKGEILSSNGVIASLEDFPFDIHFKTVEYLCEVHSNGNVKKFNIQGTQFSKELKLEISQMKSKDYLVIKNIIVVGSDNKKRELKEITYTIK